MIHSVLYVTHHDLCRPSAPSVNCLGRIRALVHLDVSVRLVCIEPPPGLPEAVEVVRVKPASAGPLAGWCLRRRVSRAVRRELRRAHPGLLISRGLMPGPLREASRAGVPSLAEAHGFLPDELKASGEPSWRVRLARRREARAARLATWVAACDHTTERLYLEAFPSLAGRTRVILNGVDGGRFPQVGPDRRHRIRFDHGFRPEHVVLGFVGLVWEMYDFSGILGAMANDASLRLLVVGDGPSLPGLREQAEAQGVAGRCSFIGRVPADQVWKPMTAMDIGVLPNRPEVPGLHLKVLEYLAADLPVLAPHCAELEPLRDDGVAALTQGTDTASVQAGIAQILRDRQASTSPPHYRHDYVMQRHGWTTQMGKLLEWIEGREA